MLGKGDARTTLENGKQHGKSTGVESLRAASGRHVATRRVGECLHFNEEWAVSFERWHDDRTGCAWPAVGKEHLAGIGHAHQATFRHFEHTEFTRRAKTVLGGAHDAQCMVAITLEREHGVDNVLEHARPSEASFFGDVANEDDGNVALLGFLHQSVRAPAHLNDGPWSAAE